MVQDEAVRLPRLSLLDRLLDSEPERAHDSPATAKEIISRLRSAVRRDLEFLLNARRPWRSVPDRLTALRTSPLQYGVPDFTAGGFEQSQERERLRAAIAEAIRKFEPRLTQVQVQLVGKEDLLQPVLHLRIGAVLLMDPMPESIMFDTLFDVVTADVTIRSLAKA
jgi:type VI secretion system protein ImpF